MTSKLGGFLMKKSKYSSLPLNYLANCEWVKVISTFLSRSHPIHFYCLHSLLTLALDGGECRMHVLVYLTSCTHWIGGLRGVEGQGQPTWTHWVREKSCLCQELNHNSSVILPVLTTLSQVPNKSSVINMFV